ncbi:MAG: NADPH-dependent 7-cyano-7-deazaguanine reductase QueF [Deltaproteobacteria bacterium]|nr:NADPH-dependent 7-cyano-7-deazaguanine reductase QueF [Deltaproteobacteria bacterium]
MNKNPDFKVPYQSVGPDTVSAGVLEALDYQYSHRRDIEINISQPEFTSLCPMTGLPDFGKISISYVPDNYIVELKSLKYYLLQYRNVGIFYEHLVNRILDDFIKVITPKRIEVSGEFSARGGIVTRVKANYDKSINV